MVIILRPQDDAEELLSKISQFLAERGLKASKKKTARSKALRQMGLTCLAGKTKVHSNGKFRCVPSVDNFTAFPQKVKHIVNNSNYGAIVKAEKLEPIVRAWRNYHRFCKMEGSRFSLYHIQHRAFKVFNQETKQNRHTSKKLWRCIMKG